jgi:hypothetical protein
MLTQRSLKRLLVFSTVEDVGFLLLGVASLSTILGISGALFAAATHALAKALLFACLSGPEADGALDGEHTGLASRYPVSAFGFLFGMLAMLGIPPTWATSAAGGSTKPRCKSIRCCWWFSFSRRLGADCLCAGVDPHLVGTRRTDPRSA